MKAAATAILATSSALGGTITIRVQYLSASMVENRRYCRLIWKLKETCFSASLTGRRFSLRRSPQVGRVWRFNAICSTPLLKRRTEMIPFEQDCSIHARLRHGARQSAGATTVLDSWPTWLSASIHTQPRSDCTSLFAKHPTDCAVHWLSSLVAMTLQGSKCFGL